jgi:hypothetical protein
VNGGHKTVNDTEFFVEYLSQLKRDRIKTKMLKKAREEERG